MSDMDDNMRGLMDFLVECQKANEEGRPEPNPRDFPPRPEAEEAEAGYDDGGPLAW